MTIERLRRLFAAGALSLLLASWAAPLAASRGRLEAPALYAGFRAVCHQDPARSLTLREFPLAVCARCSGVYAGIFLAAAAGWGLSHRKSLKLLLAISAATALEASGAIPDPLWLRLADGAALGALLAAAALGTPRRR